MVDTPPSGLKAACIQLRSGLSRERNIADAIELIERAAGAGATFISTPEMTNVVDRKAKRLLADLPGEEDLPEVRAFAETAQRLGVWLHAGSFAVRDHANSEPDQAKAHNRAFVFSPTGEITARYDKLHMFDVTLPHGETWRESAVYTPGDKTVIADVGGTKVGLSICYDVRFPAMYRQLAKRGAQIFCIPAAFTRQTGRAHWETLLRARAIECGAFVVAAAQGGDHEDGRETWGHSMIIDPWGAIIAHLDHDEPGFMVADLDLTRVDEVRQRIPNLALDHPALDHLAL